MGLERTRMSAVSITCFVIGLLVLLSLFMREADRLSPSRVFLLVWSTAIGLADLKLSRLQVPWSQYSWTVLFLGVFALWNGVLMSNVLYMGRHHLTVKEIRARLSSQTINKRRLFWLVVTTFVAYMVCFIAETVVAGGLPVFAAKPDMARIQFGMFGLHLIVSLMPSILFLAVESFLLVRGQKGDKFIIAGVFVLTTISFFMLLQRFSFVHWAIMTLALTYYASSQLSLKHLVIAVGSLVGMFLYLRSLRFVLYVENYSYVISGMKYDRAYAAFTEPYMYIVMNVENFARGVDKLEQYTYGYFTADFLMALTGLKHWLADYFQLVERPFLTSGYNTFPFLWPYYNDFGIVGMTLISLIIGVVIGVTYHRMRTDPNLVNITLYSTFVFFLVISFFTNPFTMLGTVTNVFFLLAANWYVTQTRTSK